MASKARGLADLGNAYSDGALSNRNVIVNGEMQVDQRNGGAAVTAGPAVTFAADRFWSVNGTGVGTLTAQQSTLSGAKSAKLTATAALSDLSVGKYMHGLTTFLEGQDVYHLNGSTTTLSFTVETNWSGNLSICLRNSGETRSYVTDVTVSSGVNVVSCSVLLEAGTVASNNSALGLRILIGFNNEGTYQTATTDAWVAGNFSTSTSSTQWTKTTGNFINVTNLQLEAGDQSTPFEHRSYADELARCQRYYQTSNGTTNPSIIPYNTTTGYANSIQLPVQMRASPTVSKTSGRYYGGAWYATINDIFGQVTPNAFTWIPRGSWTAYVPRLGELSWTADAEL